jgi:subtilisin family serine protease
VRQTAPRAALAACCAALAALVAVAVVQAPAAAVGQGGTLVELRRANACDAEGVLRRAGAEPVSTALRLFRLDATSAARVLRRLRACHAVRFTTPDRPVGTLSVSDFGDPLVSAEWWRPVVGVADLTPPGPGKAVTIVDSGVDVSHPELLDRPDLVLLNTQEPQPIGGVHGTAVASLIGAPVNGVGIVGIYPEAVLQSWDSALGEGTRLATSDIVAGVLAAADGGPGVINLSLGGNGRDEAIQQAIAVAVRKGMLVVAAAGNDGEIGSPLTYPASLPHVLTVGATDEQNRVVSFSSRSRFVDLAAPGQDMMVASAPDQSWASEDGTSFAAPLVSGAAAWVWTTRPALDASQLFEVMRRSATDVDAPGRDNASGYGLLNVPAALTYQAPVKDPLEPNDDVNYVQPGGTFYTGIPPLTTRPAPATALVARLAVSEDPRDVYRVFVPARGRITVKTTTAAGVDLTLWKLSTTSVVERNPGADRLARGTTQGVVESVSYKNPGLARTILLAVTLPPGAHDATYRISVTAR